MRCQETRDGHDNKSEQALLGWPSGLSFALIDRLFFPFLKRRKQIKRRKCKMKNDKLKFVIIIFHHFLLFVFSF